MPNALAYLMLFVWPVVATVLYKRLDPARALIWTILGGYLILPPLTALSIPLVPDLDKISVPNLMALLLSLTLLKDRIAVWPQARAGRILLLLFVLSPFATVLTNSDPVVFTTDRLPGLRLYDSIATVANQAIAVLPFFLARRYLATPEAMRAMTVALVAAGLAYSLPMLIEVRLSPQMNVWVYGFFQHDFAQMVRSGGYRPLVFLPHGLWAAFFVVMTVLSALVLFRAGPAEDRPKWLAAALWMLAVLVLCKSLGPLLYALCLGPVILFAGRRTQLLLAAAMALLVITYPILRGAHLVPLDTIVGLAGAVDPERAASVRFRFDNEEMLLARAAERPLFGWGLWGRNLIHDAYTGQAVTISDGTWVILMGVYGWFGYIAQFGLLVLPLLLLGREALRQPLSALSPFVAAVALIYGANLVDLLPNATIIPFTWLMAGALLGHAEALSRAASQPGPLIRKIRPVRPRTVL